MTVNIYINDDNTATFVCPQCKKTTIKDLTKFIQLKNRTRLKATCACGFSYAVFLEKRKKFRKPVNLPGRYKFSSNNPDIQDHIGAMTVKDISYSGLRIKVQMMPGFKVGDTLYVEFRLDDAKRSQVKKKVIIKNLKGLNIGLAFASPQNHDSVLGFYLFN